MKWILAILLLISAATYGQIGQGDDSTKYIRYQNQYGMRMPRGWFDSVFHIPYYDTSRFKPQKAGAIMMHLDKNIYKWNGGGWDLLGGGSPSGSAGGDLTGTYPNPTVTANAITTAKINNGAVTIPKLSATGTPDNTTFLRGDDTWATAGGVITTTNIAYVDSSGNDGTGQIDRPDKPFLTINAALDALPSGGGIIDIGIGEFLVPDSAKVKSNVWFKGSGMPQYDGVTTISGVLNYSTTTITKMIGGTILHGFFIIPYNRNNVDMSDLGVDNGSAWVNANNGGTALDCIGYAQRWGAGGNSADGFHLLQTSTNPRTGINVWNVSALVKGPTESVHSFIFENMINAKVHNIYSCYGFAGIVIKTMYSEFTQLHAMGHNDAGIYLKANDYSHCYGNVIDGFVVTSVGTNDGGGVHINSADAGSPGVFYCTIANGQILKATYGIKSTGSVQDNITIQAVNVGEIQGDGFNFANMYYSLLTGLSARSCGGDGMELQIGGTTGLMVANGFFASCGGNGMNISGSGRVDIDNVNLVNNTGYGITTSNSNVYIGWHYETGNGSGATNGTLNSKLTPPLKLFDTKSQYYWGPDNANASTLFANNTASYHIHNGYYDGTQLTHSNSSKQAEFIEMSIGGLSLYNSGSGNTVMSPIKRFSIDSTGQAYLPFGASDATATDSALVLDRSNAGKAVMRKVSGGVTSVNSMTGPAITIQGGTAVSVNNSSNTVTVAVVPGSSALPHTLIDYYTDANNTGTSETDLYTYTAPANTLAVDGQKITFEYGGLLNDATATANLQVYFAGTAIGGTGALSISGTGTWTAKGFVIRTSSSTIRAYVTFTVENASGKVFTSVATVGSLDFTGTNILKITGTAGGAGGGNDDITGKIGYVMFIPIPI